MAKKGFRLIRCHILSYEFEKCKPSEYEYTIVFVGEKSLSARENYEESLRNLGYKILLKNINVNYSIGKVTWRPWATGWGQIATSPGTYNKELLIIEKRNDGKPFKLHKNLREKISMYRSARNMYLWGLAVLLLIFFYSICSSKGVSIVIFILRIFIVAFCILWAVPAIKLILTIRKLENK